MKLQDIHNKQIEQNIHFNELKKSIGNINYDAIYVELNLTTEAKSCDIITWNKDKGVWKEYDNCSMNQCNYWVSSPIIDHSTNLQSFANKHDWQLDLDTIKSIEKKIDGELLHIGYFNTRDKDKLKAVFAIDNLAWSLEQLQYPNRDNIMFFFYLIDISEVQLSMIINNPDKIGIEIHTDKHFIQLLYYLASFNYISNKAVDNALAFIDNKCMFAHYKISYNKGIIDSIKLYLVYA